MIIAEILRSKGSAVVTVPPGWSIPDAMRLLVEHDIGALVVVEDRLRGILTERDLLRAGAARPDGLAGVKVEDLMTREVVTTTPDADIRQVMDVMTERRIRHLPVMAAGTVCGMISIGDVVNALRQHVETENRQLHAYITGTPL